MASTKINGVRIAGISTCVPSRRFDNIVETKQFTEEEVKKVVAMAGVKARRLADDSICSSDLCVAAADKITQILRLGKRFNRGIDHGNAIPGLFAPLNRMCCP